MKRKMILLIMSVLISSLLSGCWSKKELTDIAIISALGIDVDGDGKFVGTFQIVNPGNVASSLQGGAGGESTSVSVYKAEGNNLVELSRSGTTKVSRRLYYSHTNLVVIGEQLAREVGIETILEGLDRDNEFRTTTTVVIARDTKAEEIVRTLTPIDKIPSNKVLKTLEYTQKYWGENISVDLQTVMSQIVSTGDEPIISGFIVKGGEGSGSKQENIQTARPQVRLEASGIGLFKKGKLLDWLDGEAARGTLFILDEITATSISVDWEDKKDVIAFELNKNKTKINVKVNNNTPKIVVTAKAEGDLGEVAVPVNIESLETIKQIEKKVEEEIKNEIELAIKQAKEHESDILRFGQKIYRTNPNVWNNLKEDWNEMHFPELPVEVNVKVQLKRTGSRTNPYLFNAQEK